MSVNKYISITCPKCGKVFNMSCCSSVNADTEKELAERVKSLDVFTVRCPECDREIHVKYPLLYVASGKGFAVFFDAGGAVPAEVPVTGLRLRVVSDYTELREKIRVLESGLSDVVIEALKAMTEKQLGCGRTVFAGLEEQSIVLMTVKGGKYMRLPKANYLSLEAALGDFPEEGFMRIDAQFAKEMLR